MTLTPRAVVVHRPSEYDELIARHGTRGQAAFFLSTRGRHIEEVESRHSRQLAAMTAVTSALPLDWRRGMVERFFLSYNVLFAMLSNGQVFSASLSELEWKRLFPEITSVNAIAFME